ncbi:MAG: hypothetical protein ACFFFG_12580 [Candidatus Thorarchaeota archaeon]
MKIKHRFLNFDKNIPVIQSSKTWQEVHLTRLFEAIGIPFENQRLFEVSLANGKTQRYVVDFWLSPGVVLECATTQMQKHYVPLRKKSLELEVKSGHLKRHDPDLVVWVLLESQQSISNAFFLKLRTLMPSVDQLFVSRHTLRLAIEEGLRCPAAGSFYQCVFDQAICEYLNQNLEVTELDFPDDQIRHFTWLCSHIYSRWAINHRAKKALDVYLPENGIKKRKRKNPIFKKDTPTKSNSVKDLINPPRQRKRLGRLSIEDIYSELENSGRFSEKVLRKIMDLLFKYRSHYVKNQPVFWDKVFKSLRSLGQRTEILNIERDEIVELRAIANELRKFTSQFSKQTCDRDEISIQTARLFYDFIDGKISLFSRIFKSGSLSDEHQESMYRALCAELTGNKPDSMVTRILKDRYESTLLIREGITIIRTHKFCDTKTHLGIVSEVLDLDANYPVISDDYVPLSNTILSLDIADLNRLITHIGKIDYLKSFTLHVIDETGNFSSSTLPEKFIGKITKHLGKLTGLKDEELYQWFIDLFADERTFYFDNFGDANWFRQARKSNELLRLYTQLYETFVKFHYTETPNNDQILIKKVRNTLNRFFENAESFKLFSSNTKTLRGISNDYWLNCLKSISQDELGYILHFDFKELQERTSLEQVRNGKRGFFNRLRYKHTTRSEIYPDQWEGVIYDNMGKLVGESYHKSQKYDFRIRKEIRFWNNTFREKILNDLKNMARINFKRFPRYLDKNTEFGRYLVNIWLEAGYLRPAEYLESLVTPQNNPLNLLKEKRVKFRVIKAENILLNDYVLKNPSFELNQFVQSFNNDYLIKKSIQSDSIVEEVIEKGLPYKYLSASTKRQVPIPRLSKRHGIAYANIFNETENAAAIRIFLDLLINSDAGKKVIKRLGFISQRNLEEILKRGNKTKLVSSWKQGVQTSNVNINLGGIPDGVVALKQGESYSNEFFVEYIGLGKASQGTYSLRNTSLFSNLIADLLRVACNSAGGKPGIVVYGSLDEFNEIAYTIFWFNNQSISRLKKVGANFAVDLNRPMIQEIINEPHSSLLARLNEVFFDTSTIDFGEDLLKFTVVPLSHRNMFALYYRLCQILLGLQSDF